MTRKAVLLLSAVLAAAPALAASKHAPEHSRERPQKVNAPVVPTPRPALSATETPEPAMDLSHALPGKALARLPSSAQQFKSLSSELKQETPQLASAKEKSDQLAAEAADRHGGPHRSA